MNIKLHHPFLIRCTNTRRIAGANAVLSVTAQIVPYRAQLHCFEERLCDVHDPETLWYRHRARTDDEPNHVFLSHAPDRGCMHVQ